MKYGLRICRDDLELAISLIFVAGGEDKLEMKIPQIKKSSQRFVARKLEIKIMMRHDFKQIRQAHKRVRGCQCWGGWVPPSPLLWE